MNKICGTLKPFQRTFDVTDYVANGAFTTRLFFSSSSPCLRICYFMFHFYSVFWNIYECLFDFYVANVPACFLCPFIRVFLNIIQRLCFVHNLISRIFKKFLWSTIYFSKCQERIYLCVHKHF